MAYNNNVFASLRLCVKKGNCRGMESIVSQLMLINGERVPSVTGETLEVQDPATEEIIDQVPMGNEEDARVAIAAANEAFKPWRKTTAHEKAELLHEVAP